MHTSVSCYCYNGEKGNGKGKFPCHSVELENTWTYHCETERDIEIILALQTFRNTVSAEVARVHVSLKVCPEVCLHAELKWIRKNKCYFKNYQETGCFYFAEVETNRNVDVKVWGETKAMWCVRAICQEA